MKKQTLKKFIKYTLLLFLLGVVVFLGYIRYGGYFLISKTDRNEIISDIKSAPQLPDNFMKVYNDLYPEALNNSGWKYAFNDLIRDRHTECPSRAMAILYGASRMRGAFYYYAQLNFVLEDNLTQQQCLNKDLQIMDFANHVIGAENFAQKYFGKPLKELNENQVLEILVRLKNPSLYNKERKKRHKIFMDGFNSLKRKLEKNRAKHE